MPVPHIHFTAEDLTRIRLAPQADRPWETALSLRLLQSPEVPEELQAWRSWARRRLGRWARPLLVEARASEDLPTFRDRLGRAEDDPWAPALRRYQDAVISPIWPALTRAVAEDRAHRTHTLLEDGLEGLLDRLGPAVHWRAPGPDGRSGDVVSLGGRGLVLVAAYFGAGTPVVVDPLVGPVVIVHPIVPPVGELALEDPPRARRPRTLDALMGSTRAAVLQALGDGCTTKELADRVGVSAASASQHATVLREAGLISTQRHGPSVLHVVTALGSAVLHPRA